jgi:hypothetical protein
MTMLPYPHESVVEGVVLSMTQDGDVEIPGGRECQRFCCMDRLTVGSGPSAWLQQAELASTRNGFGAALDLEFAKDVSIVPLDSVEGEEQPPSYLLIGASPRHELEDFDLARAECFDQRLGG